MFIWTSFSFEARIKEEEERRKSSVKQQRKFVHQAQQHFLLMTFNDDSGLRSSRHIQN